MARCPHCSEFISEVVAETITVDYENVGKVVGIGSCCPTEDATWCCQSKRPTQKPNLRRIGNR